MSLNKTPATQNRCRIEAKTPWTNFSKTPYLLGKRPITQTMKKKSTQSNNSMNFSCYSDVPQSSNNHTFNVMNISSSTEVEDLNQTVNTNATSITSGIPSFSPFMRKIENTIDEKLATFFEALKNQTMANYNANQTTQIAASNEIQNTLTNDVSLVVSYFI